ncbi:MAG: carotenoid 1,2-hydratase [Betaproteobacteria bacterium HGW-Betaproteobacteria-13]|jgi:predicted secreted hydrolase|nr:MAG: carotenoid 1,2-hydratase [Betaproteobacteria bacterium HGW-Betaproteobacteria-19]PKO81310.1 MAG: carotenoid 1,2-hydratase [Betaproteobacteria bacterium HGW-Betaproteobacteria-13]
MLRWYSRMMAAWLFGAVCMSSAACLAANDTEALRGVGLPYPAVTPGAALAFPRDHGAHPEFRTEWWYITGWLSDEAGVERGFQLTFFRVRPRIGEGSPSRFSPSQLMLAHAAVADPGKGRLLHAERAERSLPPLAGAGEAHTDVRIRDWSLTWSEAPDTPGVYRARVGAGEFAFDLELRPDGVPVLNGEGGYSRKAPDPKHASYYYSRPHLKVSGQLRAGQGSHRVTGTAWLDHEWSSEIMPADARGWDWIGINLNDGGALMAFRMRGEKDIPVWSAATLRDADGSLRTLEFDEVRFVPRREWRSLRSGATYPVEWSLRLAGTDDAPERTFRIVPLMDDQELDSRASTGAIYWEGAVRLFEGDTELREIGKGYLEMTGYAERLEM